MIKLRVLQAMRRLRVAAISYLNTAPLMWDFQHPPDAGLALSSPHIRRVRSQGTVEDQFDVFYTSPAECAEALRTGTADIGIVPVAAYATIPDLIIIPDVAIASRGAVRSILLISKVPFEEIRTVAADKSSRTSVALCRVLFRHWYGGGRQFTAMTPNLVEMLRVHDAALLIGDAALLAETSGYRVYDLGQLWTKKTGLPFVYAFWAVRAAAIEDGFDTTNLADVFRGSRDRGLRPSNLLAIARDWAPRLQMAELDILNYLTRNIYYHLDGESIQGLQLFFQYAVEHNLLAGAPALRFFERSALMTGTA